MTQRETSTPDTNTNDRAPVRRRKRPLLRGISIVAGVLLLLPLLLAGLLLAAVYTETGTRTVWQLAERYAPGRLSGTVSGTLAEGLALRNVSYRDDDLNVAVNRIDGKWRLDLSPLKLTVDHLRIDTVDARLPPSPDEKKPTVLPESLELPLALDIREVTMEQLILRDGETETRLSDLRLQAESDGVRHRLTLERLDTPFGRARANARLSGQRPFPIEGDASLQGDFEGEAYRVDARLSGTLPELNVNVDARSGDKLRANAVIDATPFADLPFKRLQLQADDINPKDFSAEAPEANFSIRADLVPRDTGDGKGAPLAVSGPVAVKNDKPGAIDEGRVPLESITADVRLDEKRQTLANVKAQLIGKASISGKGELVRNEEGKFGGAFAFDVAQLNLKALHGALQPTQLWGPVNVRLVPGEGDALDTQHIALKLQDDQYKITLAAELDEKLVQLETVELQAYKARLSASGQLGRGEAMAFEVQGELDNFDPAQWIAMLPENKQPEGKGNGKGPRKSAGKGKQSSPEVVDALINMDFEAVGKLNPEIQAKLVFDVHDSTYGGLPMTGGGTLQVAGERLLPSDAQVTIAGNVVDIKGSFGAPDDTLNINVDAPQLARLGYGLEGALKVDAEVSGTMDRPNVRAEYEASQLAFGGQSVESLSGQANIEGAALDSPNALANAKLSARVNAKGVKLPDVNLNNLMANLDGSFAKHSLDVSATGKLRGKPLNLTAEAQGGLKQKGDDYAWDGTLQTLESKALPRFKLAKPVAISASPGNVSVGDAQLTVADAQIKLGNFTFDDGRIATEGEVSDLDIKKVLELVEQFTGAAPPIQTDLVLDARWNLSLGDTGRGFVEINRRKGDVMVSSNRGAVRLGLKDVRLRADIEGRQLKFDIDAAATRIGTVDAEGQVTLHSQDGMLTITPESPLTARATVRVPELQTVGGLVGPELALDGNVAMNLTANGTVGQPELSGTVAGDNLAITLFDLGIQLRDGTVRVDLTEDVVTLRQAEFHGGGGTLRATGQVKIGEPSPALTANVVADQLQLFASPDRRLVISGQAKATNVDEQLRVDGKFLVNRALFTLPPKSAPSLGDDVVIVDEEGDRKTAEALQTDTVADDAGEPAGAFAPVTNVTVDLGKNFRFKGAGAELRLVGEIKVHSEPQEPLTASGTVRVAEGTYEAFGRKLDIERGLVNFQGPINNPNINILAMKRDQEVAAGVEVTGFAQQPRIQLVSEPSVSDEEKLSWLMFGHGTASAGTGQINATAAALTFLGNQGGKRIAKRVGLDEFSIGASESGLNEQQVVNLGKAISENFTVGYEQSLTGAASIAKLTWQLSQRWSLIARAGAINSLNVLFNQRYD
jgi:translocation and assembly module TamB